jgi:Tfp pilus assembly protein PilV
MDKLIPLVIIFVFVFGLVGLAVLLVRWSRESSQRAAFLGWGAELMGAGMNPQPPAKIQLEEAGRQTRIKKDSESGDPVHCSLAATGQSQVTTAPVAQARETQQ